MKLMINVPEDYYYTLAAKEVLVDKPLDYIQKIILDGTPFPKGRWEYRNAALAKSCILSCSNCGHMNFSYATPYCPNCGAKMEEK